MPSMKNESVHPTRAEAIAMARANCVREGGGEVEIHQLWCNENADPCCCEPLIIAFDDPRSSAEIESELLRRERGH